MSFTEEITKNIEDEYKALQPAIVSILKKGMEEGEKRNDEGLGIDKIQLDSAKAASQITQYYSEQLIGKPLNKTELSGKNGSPLSVTLNYVLSDKSNIEDVPIEVSSEDSSPDNIDGEYRKDSPDS